MATIRAYTTIEQSRKLAEILPIESADMVLLHEEPYETSDSMFDGLHQALCVPFTKYDKSWRQKYKNISYFPCWSLASLLEVLKQHCERLETTLRINKNYNVFASGDGFTYRSFEEYPDGIGNLIDACVAMIIKLHEMNLLKRYVSIFIEV